MKVTFRPDSIPLFRPHEGIHEFSSKPDIGRVNNIVTAIDALRSVSGDLHCDCARDTSPRQIAHG